MPEMAIIEEFLAAGEAGAAGAAEGAATTAVAETSQAVEKAATGSNVEVTPPASVKETARKSRKSSGSKLGKFVPSLNNFPTGSVGLLVLIALFLVFAIVPAPGQRMSRLQLLWQAFLGNATFGEALSGESPDGHIINTPNPDGSPGWTLPNNDWIHPPAVGSPTDSIGAQWGGGFY
jgi:hypothetical protein